MDKATLRAQLEIELDTLIRRQGRIDAHLKNEEHAPPADWTELASFRENDEVLEHLDDHTRRRVGELFATLSRLDTEDWGVCEECGKAIGEGRLGAMPTATLCVRCAEKRE